MYHFRIHLLVMQKRIHPENQILRWVLDIQGLIQIWEWNLSTNRYVLMAECLMVDYFRLKYLIHHLVRRMSAYF